jgi:hypothetical protein
MGVVEFLLQLKVWIGFSQKKRNIDLANIPFLEL